jgi:hypothetical protein
MQPTPEWEGTTYALRRWTKRNPRLIEALACRVGEVETATDGGFRGYFVDATGVPLARHSFRHLERALPMPVVGEKASAKVCRAAGAG